MNMTFVGLKLPFSINNIVTLNPFIMCTELLCVYSPVQFEDSDICDSCWLAVVWLSFNCETVVLEWVIMNRFCMSVPAFLGLNISTLQVPSLLVFVWCTSVCEHSHAAQIKMCNIASRTHCGQYEFLSSTVAVRLWRRGSIIIGQHLSPPPQYSRELTHTGRETLLSGFDPENLSVPRWTGFVTKQRICALMVTQVSEKTNITMRGQKY